MMPGISVRGESESKDSLKNIHNRSSTQPLLVTLKKKSSLKVYEYMDAIVSY